MKTAVSAVFAVVFLVALAVRPLPAADPPATAPVRATLTLSFEPPRGLSRPAPRTGGASCGTSTP